MSDETTKCSACHGEYNQLDPDAVKRHTEPISTCSCRRCKGKPGCYPCGDMYCICPLH